MRATLWLAPVYAATLSLCAAAADFPGFAAQYKANRTGLGAARSTVTLKRQTDASYSYDSYSKPIGVAGLLFGNHRVIEHSILKRIEGRILPLEYSYRHKGSSKNRDIQLRFDWEQHRVDGIVRGESKQIELPADGLDQLSLQLALMQDLQSARTDLSYTVISRDRFKTYQFTHLGNDTVELPVGSFATVKLQRKKDDDKDTTYTTWYALELNYLPIKTVKRERGKVVLTVTLESVSWQEGVNARAVTAIRPQSSSARAE